MKRYSFLVGGMLMAGTSLIGTVQAAEVPGPRISSPVLGYVFDDTVQAIRVISGVPGAASLGGSVDLPAALVSATVHSGARVAVGITKEGKLALVSWVEQAQAAVIETELNSLALAAFSRSGNRVALSDGATVEVWSTSGTPALVSRHRPDAGVTAVAVNNDGAAAVATAAGITRFTGDYVQSIAGSGEWTALAFSADGNDVIAADSAHDELVRITGEGGRVSIASLPETAGAIAVSRDGESFAVSLASSLLVVSATGAVAPVVCDCQPKGLDILQGGLAVHVRGTALLLDADAGEPRLTRLPNQLAGGAN